MSAVMVANSTARVAGSIVSELAVLRSEGCCSVTGCRRLFPDERRSWPVQECCLKVAETSDDTASFWAEQACQRLRQFKTAVGPSDVIRPTSQSRRSGEGARR